MQENLNCNWINLPKYSTCTHKREKNSNSCTILLLKGEENSVKNRQQQQNIVFYIAL